MRAAIYSRVSADRANGRSVAEQEAENRAVVEREGWTVVGAYTDNDRGASRHSKGIRNDWAALGRLLEAGGADVLVTWEASRSTRDLEVYVGLRDLCRRHGVLWCYNGRTYDVRRSDDAFTTGLDILLAEKEADQTRERVLRAMRANAGTGRPHGKLLYGYRREYDLTSGQLVAQVIHDDQAAVVREIARRVLAGESCYAIAVNLNDRALPAPRGGQWDLTQVRRVATNPGYAARRVHRGQVVGPAAWPPILDDLTHHRLLARLTDPARRTVSSFTVRHLLTGIARCGLCDCGAVVRLMSNRGIPTYTCSAGFHVARKQEWVDTLVVDTLLGRLARPDAVDLFAGDESAARDALTEAADKRARLAGFYDAAAAGEISPAALARIEARLLPEVDGAERRAREQTSSPAVMTLARPNPAPVWEGLTVPQRREVVSTLVDVAILRTSRRNRTFDPATVEIRWRAG